MVIFYIGRRPITGGTAFSVRPQPTAPDRRTDPLLPSVEASNLLPIR